MSNPPVSPKSRVLISLSPTIGFLVVNYGFGLTEAMIAATLTSAVVIALRWRKGRRIGILLPASLAYVVIRGTAGVLTGSEDVYFGLGVALSAAQPWRLEPLRSRVLLLRPISFPWLSPIGSKPWITLST
jgi:hypothetical protein